MGLLIFVAGNLTSNTAILLYIYFSHQTDNTKVPLDLTKQLCLVRVSFNRQKTTQVHATGTREENRGEKLSDTNLFSCFSHLSVYLLPAYEHTYLSIYLSSYLLALLPTYAHVSLHISHVHH